MCAVLLEVRILALPVAYVRAGQRTKGEGSARSSFELFWMCVGHSSYTGRLLYRSALYRSQGPWRPRR